jgi:hypothetical protein
MPIPLIKIRDEKYLQDSSPILTSIKDYLQNNRFHLQLSNTTIKTNHGSEPNLHNQIDGKICESDTDVSDGDVDVYL